MSKKKQTSIVIVEDENLVAMDLKDRLEGLGYRVPAMVSSGEDVLPKVEETKPDLVLMDIRLRGKVDGVAAAKTIRSFRDIPIIYLTAHSDPKTLDRAKITEPYGYILKPYEERELHIAIEMALYKHWMESQMKALLKEHQEALSRVKALGGLLPMCTHCKKIRDDEGYWADVADYISKHSEASVSHGLCPDCSKNDLT